VILFSFLSYITNYSWLENVKKIYTWWMIEFKWILFS
jgi:hypothetical protein